MRGDQRGCTGRRGRGVGLPTSGFDRAGLLCGRGCPISVNFEGMIRKSVVKLTGFYVSHFASIRST